jgi:hypothetical protein
LDTSTDADELLNAELVEQDGDETDVDDAYVDIFDSNFLPLELNATEPIDLDGLTKTGLIMVFDDVIICKS